MSASLQHGEVTLNVAIRRYFQVVLFLLIFTGFGTLASTGRLDTPTVVLVTGALLFRGYALARRLQFLLSERSTNLLTVACVAFYIADEFAISRNFLESLVHLVLFVMLVRLFSAQKDRDHYLLAALSFVMVLAAAVLTVDSTFLIALGGFVLVGVAAFILMEMMHSAERSPVLARDPNVYRAYRKLSFTIAGIAPILLLLIFCGGAVIFFCLPRISAGYLSANTGASDITSGFSDRVELGRIGEIQQSKAVVMHVQVDGDSAGAFALKLRGISLSNFDGRNWSSSRQKFNLSPVTAGRFDLLQNQSAVKGQRVHYRVTMEPFIGEVFFLLSTPRSLQGNYRAISEDSAGDVFDLDLERPVNRYEADSELRRPVLAKLHAATVFPSDVQPGNLQLPELDPRIPALAEQIAAKAVSPYDKAASIENYLRSHFEYTLQLPKTLPHDPIANFLFVRQQGHCEYFASSMAIMLRTIGIPARVVNGFSGGEFNDITSQYVVRASDAHSWVEAYIPGEGWMEFDPTPAGSGQGHTQWSRFTLYMDAMSSFWREWIVNYDLAHQLRLTQDANRGSREIVGQAQSWGHKQYDKMLDWARRTQDRIGVSGVKWGLRGLVLTLLALLAASGPRLLTLFRRFRLARRPRKSPQMAASIWYEHMLRHAARRGWRKSAAQTPDEFVRAIGDEQLRNRVAGFTETYENARFGRSAEDAERLPELYDEIKSSR